jgi:hypothetical protein
MSKKEFHLKNIRIAEVVLIKAQRGKTCRVRFRSVCRRLGYTRRFLDRTGTILTSCWRTAPHNTGNDKGGEGPGRGTVAHALTTTHWLAPKWGGQSPLLSLSNNTNTNQPTNRGRQEERDHKRCVGRGGLSRRVETQLLLLFSFRHWETTISHAAQFLSIRRR